MKRRPIIVDGEPYDCMAEFLATLGINQKTSRKAYDAAYFKMKKGRPFVHAGRKYFIRTEPEAPKVVEKPEKRTLLRKPQTMGLHQDKGEHWL